MAGSTYGQVHVYSAVYQGRIEPDLFFANDTINCSFRYLVVSMAFDIITGGNLKGSETCREGKVDEIYIFAACGNPD